MPNLFTHESTLSILSGYARLDREAAEIKRNRKNKNEVKLSEIFRIKERKQSR